MRNLEVKSKYHHDRYVWLKSRGICTCCAKEDAFDGGILCPDCWEKKQLSMKVPTEDEKEAHRLWQRELRKTRINLRQCVTCGDKLSDSDGTRCETCAKKHNASGRKCRKRGISREQASYRGLCIQCRKNPVVENRTICLECLERGREHIKMLNSRRNINGNSKKSS